MTDPSNIAVSVVIPCYNHGKYINDAVDSCLDSTFQDIEIIVVNDGSTDPLTLDVLNQLNKPKTKVIHIQNRGLASARNTGIANAQGNYILPLDADDKIDKTLIEKTIIFLENEPEIGYVYTWTQRFGNINTVWKTEEFNAYVLLFRNLCSVTALFRKAAWAVVGGFNEKMKLGYEDWDFWISVVEKGWIGYRIPEPLFYYRKHEGSMLANSKKYHHLLVKQIRANHPAMYAEERLNELKKLWMESEVGKENVNGKNEAFGKYCDSLL